MRKIIGMRDLDQQPVGGIGIARTDDQGVRVGSGSRVSQAKIAAFIPRLPIRRAIENKMPPKRIGRVRPTAANDEIAAAQTCQLWIANGFFKSSILRISPGIVTRCNRNDIFQFILIAFVVGVDDEPAILKQAESPIKGTAAVDGNVAAQGEGFSLILAGYRDRNHHD